jgi:hypothetical protein
MSVALVLSSFALVSAYAEREIELTPFATAAGQFSIHFPGKPNEAATQAETSLGATESKVFTIHVDDCNYSVVYSDYTSAQIGERKAEEVLKASVGDVLKVPKIEVVSKESISQDGFPGIDLTCSRELTIGGTTQEYLIRSRMILVKRRLFTVGVNGPAAKVKTPTTEAFFKSFKLTAKPTPTLAITIGEAASKSKVAKSTAPFKTYLSKTGRFRVSFPGVPREISETAKTDAGDIKQVLLKATNRDGVYSVGYADWPGDFLKAHDTAQLLDQTTAAIMAAANGTFVNSKTITGSSIPGREVVYDVTSSEISGKATARVRVYLSGDRVYQVTALVPRGSARSATVEAFFTSFQIDRTAPAKKGRVGVGFREGVTQDGGVGPVAVLPFRR